MRDRQIESSAPVIEDPLRSQATATHRRAGFFTSLSFISLSRA
jgi:hypothetical protein